MKVLSLVITFFLVSRVFAQDTSKAIGNSQLKIHSFELVVFNEQSLSYKYNFKERLSLKFGIDISGSMQKDGDRYEANNHEEYVVINRNYNLGLRINSQIYYQFFNSEFAKFNFGLGPSLYYSVRKSTSEYSNNSQEIGSSFYCYETGLLSTLSNEFVLSEHLYLLCKIDYLLAFGMTDHYKNGDERSYKETGYYFDLKLSKLEIGFGFWL